ncbi:MAG: histidinol dehydrogenase [Cyanobacteriota bacterium ELA615]|jgi:histidinol dehydrogenase
MGNINSILQIITQLSEAEVELQRINQQHPNPAQLKDKASKVREILTDVLLRGDDSLLEYSPNLQVSGSQFDAAYQQISQEFLKTVRATIENLTKFYQLKIPKSWVHFAEEQVIIGKRYTPLKRIGIHIDKETKKTLTMLMLTLVCANVAQVDEKVLFLSPTVDERSLARLLVAAQEAGVSEVYRLEPIQSLAAMAYGTSTIGKVDLIMTSGDLELTLAQQMISGQVRIESYFNQANLMIFADGKADPLHLALDSLFQLEDDSRVIFISQSLELAHSIAAEVTKRLQDDIYLAKTLVYRGQTIPIIVVDSLDIAIKLINGFAPQSLQLAIKDPWSILNKIDNAGTIFMGYNTPQIVGDYFGGSAINLLGTGVARYASALSVETFLKQSNVIEYSAKALKKLVPSLEILSQADELLGEIDSIRARLEGQEREL